MKGLNCALKLRKNRKIYKKVKKSPFLTNSHIQDALVLETREVEARQPNSAKRKCVKVELKQSKKKKLVFVPYCGGRTFVRIHDTVTIQSIGGSRGRAKGDLWGLSYKVIKVNGVCLKEKFLRKK